MIELYDDQKELLESVRSSIRRGNKSVLIQACAGSGKTVVGAAMIAGSQAKGMRSLFVVPRKELRNQTAKTMDSYNLPYSYVSSGMPYNEYNKTFIATSGTLVNKLGKLPKMNLVFLDECHIGADGFSKIVSHYKNEGAVIVGLSATPTKLSGRGMGDWFDDMVCGKSAKWLIEHKRISEYKPYIIDVPDLSGIKITAGEYNHGQLSSKMESDRVLVGNAVKYYKEHSMGMLGVTYTTSRKHSEIVAEDFRNNGIPSTHIDGTMSDDERAKIIKAFARREILQLVNCEILTYGFDLSAAAQMDVTIECLTDLQPTQSLAKQIQKWFRVLRYKAFPAVIYDSAGNIMNIKGELKHGFPCDDREWSLQGTTKTKREGKERAVKIMQCTRCYYAQKPNYERKCSNCGYIQPVQERDIKTVDGELREIKAGDIAMKPAPNRQGQKWALIAQAKRMGIKDPAGQIKFAEAVIRKQMEKRGEVSEG